MERAVRTKRPEEVTVGINLADESIAWTRQVVTRRWVYLCIGDEQRTSQILYVEGSKIHRDTWVGESSGQGHECKSRVVNVDLFVRKVCRVEKVRHTVVTYGESGIDVARVARQNAGNSP